jgi:hypothetical protein
MQITRFRDEGHGYAMPFCHTQSDRELGFQHARTPTGEEEEMTILERTFIRRGHPRWLILGMVGAIWAFYFLWLHNWASALVAIFVSGILGTLLTGRMNEERLAQTTLGKIMLLHLHPVNLAVQIAGFALLVYSVWIHSAMYMMVAISAILIGHMWGWSKVSEAL